MVDPLALLLAGLPGYGEPHSCHATLMQCSDPLAQPGIGLRPCRGRAIQPRVIATGGDLQDAAQRSHRIVGLIPLHEFQPFDGIDPVSRANQAAAFDKISRAAPASCASPAPSAQTRLRPDRTNSTICRRNSGGYAHLRFDIVDSSFPKDECPRNGSTPLLPVWWSLEDHRRHRRSPLIPKILTHLGLVRPGTGVCTGAASVDSNWPRFQPIPDSIRFNSLS